MLTRELLAQVRRLQLRARRAVADPLGGAYRSVFKGVGIAFEDVREYQPGDDIRSIDWNVTARAGHPFIKRYVEERELTVMLVVDASASMSFGTQGRTKRATVALAGALLALCALRNNDRVGLLLCSDVVEKFVPPRKTSRHALRLIRELCVFQPGRRATGLRVGLDFVNRVLRRRALVFVMSDFLDAGFEKALARTGQRHDVVALAVRDPRELALPPVGLVRIEDAETGVQRLVDTADRRFQQAQAALRNARHESLHALAAGGRLDIVELSTTADPADALVRFFRGRARRRERHA